MKQQSLKRKLAFLLTASLLAVQLTGCGKASDSSTDSQVQQKGRYLETELALPQEWTGKNIANMFRGSNDQLHFLLSEENGDTISLEEWTLGEDDSLEDQTPQWLQSISLPAQGNTQLQLLETPEGDQYLYASMYEEDTDTSTAKLWKEDNGTARDITPEKWSQPTELYGYTYYDCPSRLVAWDGKLVGLSYLSLDIYQGSDGTLLSSTPVDTLSSDTNSVDNQWFALRDNTLYLCQVDQQSLITGLLLYSLTEEGISDSGKEISFSQDNFSSTYFSVLENGTIYAADSDGFFQYNEVEDSWKEILNGMDTSFSLSSLWCKGVEALPDGSLYGLFGGDDRDHVMIYRYDPDAVIEVSEELHLYSVNESFLLQQAAVQYHKKHPEVLIQIENAVSLTDSYSSHIDYQKLYQDLNTSLTSGNAADILVMDHLNPETYASKGLLLDLSDVLDPLETDGTLLSNIISSYVGEDGSRYAVPLQFGLMMAIGRDLEPAQMESLSALSQALQGKPESYFGPLTCGELVERLSPYITDEILQNKTLNKDALKTWLTQVKIIADNSGILENRPKDERAANSWDLGTAAKLVLEEEDGFNQCMFPLSIAELLNANVSCMEHAYVPKLVMGINSQSEHKDTAVDFLKFMLSQEVQDTDTYEGFPVNAASLEVQAKADRSDAAAYTTYEVAEGVVEELKAGPFSEETANHLVDLCENATLCIREDVQIQRVLEESLPAYLNGSMSLDETIQTIEGSLKMYLEE